MEWIILGFVLGIGFLYLKDVYEDYKRSQLPHMSSDQLNDHFEMIVRGINGEDN